MKHFNIQLHAQRLWAGFAAGLKSNFSWQWQPTASAVALQANQSHPCTCNCRLLSQQLQGRGPTTCSTAACRLCQGTTTPQHLAAQSLAATAPSQLQRTQCLTAPAWL